jgi:hypothetical protein
MYRVESLDSGPVREKLLVREDRPRQSRASTALIPAHFRQPVAKVTDRQHQELQGDVVYLS